MYATRQTHIENKLVVIRGRETAEGQVRDRGVRDRNYYVCTDKEGERLFYLVRFSYILKVFLF